jgi:hypothetical protein
MCSERKVDRLVKSWCGRRELVQQPLIGAKALKRMLKHWHERQVM